MSSTQLHRCLFYEWNPSPITSVTITSDSSAVLVGREGGAVESWDTHYWCCQRNIHLELDSISCIIDDTTPFFIVGGAGSHIFRLDSNLLLKETIFTHGGGVHDMIISRDTLYISCVDSTIRYFSVSRDSLEYGGVLKQFENPVLSVDANDFLLACGEQTGQISLINLENGQFQHRMAINRTGVKNVAVHALKLTLNGDTLISGDSTGAVTFWDTNTGTIFQETKTHDRDVLALTLCENADQADLFVSGIDHKVAHLVLSIQTETSRLQTMLEPVEWKLMGNRRIHHGNINDISASSHFVVTGSNDCHIGLYRRRNIQDNAMKLNPFFPRHESSFGAVSRQSRLLITSPSGEPRLELHRIGENIELCKKLLTIKVPEGSRVISCSIDEGGSNIFCSLASTLHRYHIQYKEGAVSSISKDVLEPGLVSLSMQSLSNRYLLLGTEDGRVIIYDTDTDKPLVIQDRSSESISAISAVDGRISHAERESLTVVITVRRGEEIQLLRATIEEGEIIKQEPDCTVPRCFAPPSCTRIHPSFPIVFIGTVTNHIFAYNYMNNTLTPFKIEKHGSFQSKSKKADDMSKNVSFSRVQGLVHTLRIIHTLDGEFVLLVAVDENFCTYTVDLKGLCLLERERLGKYGHILFIEELGEGELLVLERPWNRVEKNLPAQYEHKRFQKTRKH